MHKLHYKQEALAWTEALPMGNGRIGAMAYMAPTELEGGDA